MDRISISLEGADSAHRHRIQQHKRRLLLFPDGIKRLIVASVWHWETYDRLKEEMLFTDEEFAAELLEFAGENRSAELDLEQQLRLTFDLYIRSWMHDRSRHANDRW